MEMKVEVVMVAVSREELISHGADVSGMFHDAGRAFHRAGSQARVVGPAPEHRRHGSLVSLGDPDGNTWFVQNVTTRLPGRVTPVGSTYGSASDLAGAMWGASVAYGEHEKRAGAAAANWPDRYAQYVVAEQARTELPT